MWATLPSASTTPPAGSEADFIGQVVVAGVDLSTDGFVLRRQAANRVGNPAVDELKPVIRGKGLGLRGKPEIEQGLVQQYTCVVPRKRSTRRVRAVHAGRETDYQQPCVGIAERRHRASVIVRVLRADFIQE